MSGRHDSGITCKCLWSHLGTRDRARENTNEHLLTLMGTCFCWNAPRREQLEIPRLQELTNSDESTEIHNFEPILDAGVVAIFMLFVMRRGQTQLFSG